MSRELWSAVEEGLSAVDAANANGYGKPNGFSPFSPHDDERRWPVLDRAALHGPVGEFVSDVAPYTEADAAGILLSALPLIGAVIGPTPHTFVGNTRHGVNLFSVLVGNTAKGRKGTAFAVPREMAWRIDPAFAENRMLGGFGSGEAFVDAVRDGDEDSEGTDDKRLIIVEPEFARMLRVVGRDGSTLGPNIREAWDGSKLQVRSRARTVVATGHHISAACQVTSQELRTRLNDAETYGGTANRFLFACTRRAQVLPDGGNVPEHVISRHVGVIGKRVQEARLRSAPMGRTDAGTEAWHCVYHRLAQDEPAGLLERIIARDDAQCLRLSMLYALLDGAAEIDAPHIEAAEAVWRYCRDSAAHVFGDQTGNSIADRILAALKWDGELSRTAIDKALGKHVPTKDIDAATDELVARGVARKGTEATGQRGRPRQVLVYCGENGENGEKPTERTEKTEKTPCRVTVTSLSLGGTGGG